MEEMLVFHYTDLKTARVVLLREWFVACPSSLVAEIEAVRPAPSLPSTELILDKKEGLWVSPGGYKGMRGGGALVTAVCRLFQMFLLCAGGGVFFSKTGPIDKEAGV